MYGGWPNSGEAAVVGGYRLFGVVLRQRTPLQEETGNAEALKTRNAIYWCYISLITCVYNTKLYFFDL